MEEIDVALDRLLTEFIVNTVSKLNERQSRIDSFITIQRLTLTDLEIANLIDDVGVARVQLEAMLNDIIRAYKSSVIGAAQTGRADAQRKTTDGNDSFRWESDGVDCPDCSNRSGRVETYAYWEAVGIPRSGTTICGASCKCVLVRV